MTMDGAIGRRPLFVAHVVMLGFLVFFLAVGWTWMSEGVLRSWRTIIAAGAVVTAGGIAGFAGHSLSGASLGASLVYWMIKPGIGLIYTGMLMDRERIYLWSGVVTLIGAEIVLASIGGPSSRPSMSVPSLSGAASRSGWLMRSRPRMMRKGEMPGQGEGGRLMATII